jgi:hypothetical protein
MPHFRLTFAPRQVFRSEFGHEWFGVAMVALSAVAWAGHVHFHLAVEWRDLLLPSLVLFAIVAAHIADSDRASLVTEYFLLSITATAVFGVFSYLSMAAGRPLADGMLASADRALGFNWIGGYRWLVHHDVAARTLQLAYNSLVYQGLYFGVFFGVVGSLTRLREMFWLVLVAGLLTSAGAALFPAMGPFKEYGITAEFLAVMEQLRSGNLHFALANMTGVVSFPSFHTTMALLYIYGFRRSGVIGWAATIINVAMLPAIPFFGGHYLVDMFAGAGVAIVSLVAVKALSAVRWHAVPQGHQSAAEAQAPSMAGGSVEGLQPAP